MSSSESRAQVMKPLLINAGIPAALSVAAYIFAKIISKRSDSSIESSSIEPEDPDSESYCSLPDHAESCDNNENSIDEVSTTSTELVQVWDKGNNLLHKLVSLESQLENLQNKEHDMESRYLSFRAKKEREFMLIEIRNKLLLEKTRAEFLLREISLAEEENKKIGGLVIESLKLVYHLQRFRTENRLLQRKARKVCRRAGHRLTIIRQQKLSIEAKDVELVSNRKEIAVRDCVIQELEDEVMQLKDAVDHLQREKIELINKVDVERSYAFDTKVEATESVTKEEYDMVLKEVEQLHKEKETEANEITYLKWSNACLRHELLKCHEQQERDKEDTGHHQLIEFFEDHQGHESDARTTTATLHRRDVGLFRS